MDDSKQNDSKKEIFKTTVQLATTGFGLVAALAWNEAIISLFKKIFGEQSGIIARFIYAIVVTVIVVLITHWLSRIAERTGASEKKE